MEELIRLINEYNKAKTGVDADLAAMECEKAFAELVRKHAPRQSYGPPC